MNNKGSCMCEICMRQNSLLGIYIRQTCKICMCDTCMCGFCLRCFLNGQKKYNLMQLMKHINFNNKYKLALRMQEISKKRQERITKFVEDQDKIIKEILLNKNQVIMVELLEIENTKMKKFSENEHAIMKNNENELKKFVNIFQICPNKCCKEKYIKMSDKYMIDQKRHKNLPKLKYRNKVKNY